MCKKVLISILVTLFAVVCASSQATPRPEGAPDGPRPPRDGQMQRPPQHYWVMDFDSNGDGKVDATELQAAMDATFAEIDKNANGMIDAGEMPRPPRPMGDRPQGPPPGSNGIAPQGPPPVGRPPGQRGPAGERRRMLPPFFFADRMGEATSTSRADFDKTVRGVFAEMDKNGDGTISQDESRTPRRPNGPNGPPEGRTPPPPNGRFIAAEMRFGDKQVKGQPFSAETVIEDTRRLFDGSTVTRSSHGAFYRDTAGRTRREQPLEMIGGIPISGTDNKGQTLVFINNFDAQTQYFLDVNNKIAHKHRIGGNPPPEPPRPADAKTESLGVKTIEGIQVEGTRMTFEIPVGRLGNGKPIQVVSESWFSPELQMIVLSRHVDPIAGEHIFKLVNIKRSEPSADLFAVPAGFKVEEGPGRAPASEMN